MLHHMKQLLFALSVPADTSLSLRFTTNSDQGMKPSIILMTPSNILYTYKIIFEAFLLCAHA